MNAPRAWEIGSPDGVGSFVTENEAIADCAKVNRMPVTPLTAAPPEGAPSWAQMAEWILRQGVCSEACAENGTCVCGLDRITAGIARLPTDVEAQP